MTATLACGGSDGDTGSGSGDADSGTTTTSGDGTESGSGSGTDTGDTDGECPDDIQAGASCGGGQCCDAEDHMWQCQCVGQCEEDCCTWEPLFGGYCIFSNDQYLCGAGNDMGESCPMDIEEGTACDSGVLEGCCADDGSIFRCVCMEACIWEREDCAVSDECVQGVR
jgi:hypothetical protein